jgi:hypothetical protein
MLEYFRIVSIYYEKLKNRRYKSVAFDRKYNDLYERAG